MEFAVQDFDVAYIVEEREVQSPSHVTYAWSCKSAEDAIVVLTSQSQQHPKRLYRVYCSVEAWVDSSERV